MFNTERQSRRTDSELEQRIRRDLAFLFDRYGAVIDSNTVEKYGNSEVLVGVGNLQFQFAKNERDSSSRVVVGPRNGHGIWELLHVALAASTDEDSAKLTCPISYTDDPANMSYIGLSKLASVLEPRFEKLNDAFAPDSYQALRSRTAQLERILHPNSQPS